jgi:VIT1/CCC1 family predicted Fe2+/Mn2+ transporter
VSKYVVPALIFCIFALFAYSITSESNDAQSEQTEPRAEQIQPPVESVKAEQSRERSPADTIDGFRGDLERLSSDVKANSDKIAQLASLRSELLNLIQESKSNRDDAAHITDEEVNALRAAVLKEAKETNDKAAQALRDEVSGTQAKLAAQIDDMLKANTTRSDALVQRADAMKKDIDDLKKNFAEDRENTSSISPGIALLVALVALVLGPYLAYQLAVNQFAGIRQQAAAQPQSEKSAEVRQPVAAPPDQQADLHRDAPPLAEEGSQATDEDQRAAPDSERV